MPGLLDLLESLLPEGGETVCPECSNNKARIVFSCPCGTKIDICAACVLAKTHSTGGVDQFSRVLDQHRNECERFASLYEYASDRAKERG